MAKYEISHPDLPQVGGTLILPEGEAPTGRHFWEAVQTQVSPYGASQLSDEAKIDAVKHGFFETPDTEWYSLLFGEMADDPETEIDETEAGIVQQMIEGGQKFSRQQLFNVTSARRKLNIMQDRLGGETIPVKEDDPYVTQFQEAGKWLRGLQENWESTGPFGEWEPKGADYSQSLGKVGLKDTPTNRRKLIWSALNEDLLQSKIDATQGGAGALMTGPFVYTGTKKFLRKHGIRFDWWNPLFSVGGVNAALMDDADPQSILDYANAAIDFDKTMFYHQEGGEAVANFLGDEEVVNRIQEGTLAADPEMALVYELLLDPTNLAGAGAAKLATAPFRIGLKGQVTKLAVGLQRNLAKKIELEALQASRGIDSSLLVTRRIAEELVEVNAEIAEQQAKLGRYGGKSKTYNLGTLGLRKAPGQVLEAAGESLDLATDAGKQAYKMALEATDAAAQRTFSQKVLGRGFRAIGGTVEAMARTLEWVTRVPENIALSRIMAANKAAGRELTLKEATAELRSMKAAATSGLAGAGLGYYVSENEGILPGAVIAVFAKYLGPGTLSKIGSVGRDMKAIGLEYSLAQTTDNLARRISKTPTPSVGLAAAEVDRAAALSTEGWFGIPGGVKGATAEVGRHPISSIFPGQTTKLPFREGLDTATEGIEAGAKGEARVVSESARQVAKFLDKTGLAKAGQVGSTFAGGALKGTAIPAGIGFLAAGGEWEGALTGAVFSAPFTAIGAGAGTFARFRSKGEVYQKLLGDKAYYRDHLTKVEKKAFDSMSNEGQIAVASLSLSNPDAVVIPVNWGRDGAPGSHQVLKDSGESVIRLNVDSPKSLLYAMRHESMHHLEAHGLRPLVDSILFGDPLMDKVGFFTKLDENKQPVKAPIGEDGIQRWELSDDFYKYKEQYMERLRKTEGVDPDSVQKYEEDPTLIGREYFSELGSDQMRTGELQKYLDRGPMAKLFGKVVETIQGREFTKNLLMKFGIPFDSTGKPLVGSGAAIFKDMKRVPELDKLVKKYANQVKNLRKEEIIGTKKPSGEREGGLAPLDFDQEASHAFSVEDIKDPHVLEILNTGGIFAHNPDGSIKEDVMGNPIRVTKKEAENARDPAVDHAIGVLEKHGQGDHIKVNEKTGKKSATIHHLSDAMLDDLAAGPLHPRQVQTLRDIAKALREGDGEDAGMLIGYYSASEGRKPKPVAYAVRKAFPISFEITQDQNILVGLLDVARLQKNLTYLKKHFPAETRAFENDNAVWEDFRTYAKNLANGVDGETGLTGDVVNKKNVLNALLGAMKEVQLLKNPILDKIGWKRATASGKRAPFGVGYKTFRLDRIFKSERSGKGIKFNQSARGRASEHLMPRQPDDTIPLPFDELPGDKPGEGFGRMINVDKTKSELAEAAKMADEQQGWRAGNVRSKDAEGRDKLFMPAAEAGAPKGKQAEAAKLWNEKGTDSPFFKKWFGKSKVVDESGEPLPLYRGTVRTPRATGWKTVGGRATPSFTNVPEVASLYSHEQQAFGGIKPKGPVTKVYMRMEKPLDLRKQDTRTYLDEYLVNGGIPDNFYPDPTKVYGYDPTHFGVKDLSRLLWDFSQLKDKNYDIEVSHWSSNWRLDDPHEVTSLIHSLQDKWRKGEIDGDDFVSDIHGILAEIKVDQYSLADSKSFTKWAKAAGYDGIIHSDTVEAGAQYFGRESVAGRPVEKVKGVDTSEGDYTIDVWRPFGNEQIKSATGNRGTFDAGDPNMLFMPAAYHGTPHTFKAEEGAPLGRFRSAQIGTGEGAQAYGHGLYFAGAKEVGEFYRSQLSPSVTKDFKLGTMNIIKNEVPIDYSPHLLEKVYGAEAIPRAALIESLLIDEGTIKRAFLEDGKRGAEREIKKVIKDFLEVYEDSPSYQKVGEKALKMPINYRGSETGSLYKVELAPKENKYLLWDKPLSEQPKGVREKLENMGLVYDKEMYPNPTGNDLYNFANSDKYSFGSDADKLSSAALKEAGIPGIKYLDGSSRSKGKGDYNYVIFDEADVAIADKLFMPAPTPESVSPNTAREGDVVRLNEESLRLFMPANDKVRLEDYADRKMFALASDRLGIGRMLTGPKGKKKELTIDAQGGRGFMQIFNGGGWAFKGKQTADNFIKRVKDVAGGEDSVIVGITILSDLNHLHSAYGQLAYTNALRAAIESGTITEGMANRQIREIVKRIKQAKTKKPLPAESRKVVEAIKNFADFEKAVKAKKINFNLMAKVREKAEGKTLPLTATEAAKLELDVPSIAKDIADPELVGADFGKVVALLEVPVNQTPKKTDFHYSYPYTIEGHKIGFLEEFADVGELTSDPKVRTKQGRITAQPLQTVMPEFDRLRGNRFMPAK